MKLAFFTTEIFEEEKASSSNDSLVNVWSIICVCIRLMDLLSVSAFKKGILGLFGQPERQDRFPFYDSGRTVTISRP